MIVKADLHIHTCLSPCGDLEMSPKNIVSKAKELGINLLAVSDHNTADNVEPFFYECKKSGIVALGGIEITTQEEAHVLGIFEDFTTAKEFGKIIYESLPNIKNIPEKFGDQIVLDIDENIIDEKEKYLISATTYSIDEIEQLIHKYGGLFIPAHIDKPIFSLISQLGFVPDLNYDALEVTTDYSGQPKFKKIKDSDAHYLDDVGKRTFSFEAEEPSFKNLKKYLKDF